MVGTTIGERYVLLERMGQGGSGTIYRAEHVTLRRKVAVKVLHHELSRDDLAIERFRREATTVGQIENEHIVEIFDFGRTADGRLYLAMELLEGETLADLIEREGQLEVDRAVDILVQLSETLMEAHAMGYIHRDLRPRNVFLAVRRGKGRREFVKLLDFGLAKLVEKEGEAASTSLGMTFGDPHYMSPEQARGDALDRRADIYSLGCIAYEMLVGEPPFVGGKVFDILTRHVEAMPVAPEARRSEVPAWLDRAVMRMLAKRADQRFITVFRVLEALRQGADSGHIMADEVARRAESIPPTSVSQAMAKLGARAPADLAAAEVPREGGPLATAPTPPPGVKPKAAVVGGEDKGEGDPKSVGGATVLGLGVAPGAAGGKRAQAGRAPSGRAPASEPPAEALAGQVAGAAARPKNGSTGAFSAVWYADGDEIGASGAGRADAPARARQPTHLPPGDTGLIRDEEYAEARRRPWPIILAVAGAVLLIGVAVFAMTSGGGDEGEGRAVAATGASAPAAVPAATTPATDNASPAPAGEAASPAGAAAAEAPSQPAAAETSPPTVPAASDAGRAASGQEQEKVAAGKSEAPKPARPRKSDGGSESKRARGRFDHIGRDDAGEREPRPARSRPGSAEAGKAVFYAKVGDRDLAAGDLVSAATNFNKARELDPNNAAAVIGLGEIALGQGSTGAAISHLRRATKLKPRSARAHTLLGDALLADGRAREASAAFRRALKIDPNDSRAQAGLEESSVEAAQADPSRGRPLDEPLDERAPDEPAPDEPVPESEL